MLSAPAPKPNVTYRLRGVLLGVIGLAVQCNGPEKQASGQRECAHRKISKRKG